MRLGQIAPAVLLGIGVAVSFLSALGVAVVRRDLDRLHFLSPLTAIGLPAVAIAVMVHESPISLAGAKVAIIVVVLWVSSPVVGHALARAERIRMTGDWRPSEREGEDRRR